MGCDLGWRMLCSVSRRLALLCFFFSSRRRHTRCALVTGVQTCALPISRPADENLVAAIADQRVRKAGPDETLDAVEPVALGVTAIARAGLEVDRDGTRVGAVVDRIDAAPSDQDIGARTALKQIEIGRAHV